MTSVELLWKDYCTYEMSINPTLAKKMIDERSRDFLNVKRVTKEFETRLTFKKSRERSSIIF